MLSTFYVCKMMKMNDKDDLNKAEEDVKEVISVTGVQLVARGPSGYLCFRT